MRPLPPFLMKRLGDQGRDLTVLVLRFGALGDVLRTLPAVRLVRSALPRARLIWALDEAWRSLLEGHPDLDEIVTLPRSRWNDDARRPTRWPALLVSMGRWGAELRDRNPDLVLDFHGNLRSGVAGWLSKATVRLGYSGHQQKEGNRLFTSHRVDAGPRRLSRMERNLSLVRALGLRCEPLPDGGLVLPESSAGRARQIVASAVEGAGPYAILSPGASRSQAYKRPPLPLLSAAVRAFANRGVWTLVVHGPGEEPEARRVVDSEPVSAKLAPPTDLRVLASLLKDARAFVGGDTGPMHLACAVGCPVVVLYGPTDPVVNAPWGVPSRVVQPPDSVYTGIKKKDRRAGRFAEIPPGAVGAAIEELPG